MSNLSILIVEDEAIVAADLAAKVRQLGYNVAGPTATGEEAVELSKGLRPALVLMDIRLAGAMDGISAAEVIHRECHLPVLFLTAHSDTGTVERARQAEAFGYILKPFDERDLRIQIEMALYKHAADEKLRQSATDLQAANTSLRNSRMAALNMMEDADRARRQAEEMSVNLQQEICERKQAEEELVRAKEAAEAATRAKSQFLANMSHELRTPMTGVLGMLDLVLSGNLEAEQQEFIEIARTSARSLVRILNDILDLTKIEAGKFAIEEKPFSLRKCVEDTVNLLLPSALSKGLDLSFTVAGDVPDILVADHLRLSQVLTNLTGNAVKFTEKGQVEIRVSAGGSTPAGKREVTFTVADTGIGIPADKKHLLFKSFSQVDDSHSRIYGGTGLGLAISKEIVERMGGTISFSSEEGKGSVFSCTIPRNETEAEQGAVSAEGEVTKAGNTTLAVETTKPRLLVVEDDPTIRQVLGQLLKLSNYEVDFAESGLEAVEIWETGQFDLILMDVQMPGMNGFEATAAIREKEGSRGGHTPIIAMTAHALKEDEERCLAAGMDSYISKPIDFKKSLQVIGDILRQQP